MTVDRDGQHALGMLLTDDVVIQVGDDLARRGDAAEKLLAGAAAAAFLIENRLA